MKEEQHIKLLQKRIKALEKENRLLKEQRSVFHAINPVVKAPADIQPAFLQATETVKEYFKSFNCDPEHSKIEIHNQRYLLLRAESLSSDFLKNIIKLYADRPLPEAIRIGRNLLFDLAHLIGIEDARNFHKKMKLKDPISKLSAGPVHFAFTGWAKVEILEDCNPSPDNNFYIKYNHPYSFEADAWLKKKEKTTFPVCSMNAGYSSGWCEESFGIELTAVEICCRAKGDKNCTFIMAPPNRINEYLEKEGQKQKTKQKYDVPLFFERKKAEEKLNVTLKEKETLLREIHHRVKNNLQIITSLLKLHAEQANNKHFTDLVTESQNRIVSMALIHGMLYANSNLSSINLSRYASNLFDRLKSTYNKPKVKLSLSVPENFNFEIDKMIPVGLILNEVMSNSFKYAFSDSKGCISISYKKNVLSVSDNGIGLTKDKKTKSQNSFGIQLIHLLAEQIDAEVRIDTKKGTAYYFSLKS